jgi:hypothetical protein
MKLSSSGRIDHRVVRFFVGLIEAFLVQMYGTKKPRLIVIGHLEYCEVGGKGQFP